ncbi:MAG: SusD/RagB family nutrient-binding outer membrane lipoprotein [Bacteroidetes bacterium]|nr:SusD/RagB family nutrient-binding outer membrane lipoprotein [Bacteroidota bacterium]MBS1609178.1 SusD/RagB family nutrient-binding outer membrane lipoprotein [Bacteroidota bacterium]
MKKIFLITTIAVLAGASSCTKKQFSDAYANPQTVNQTTIEKQFSGFLAANLDYVMYRYWNYFVILQNTALPWSQATGILNNPGRYVPGAAAVTDRWKNFYSFLAQYKEFLNLYSKQTDEEKADKRLYYIAATIYFYDHTEKVVDLHGNIPWSEAGLLSTNGGDYSGSYAKYDDAATIYTTMLDNLKGFADELNSINVSATVAAGIKTQDFINHGDVTLWKKYCNSLRLRMLTRVSGVSSFQSRVSSEIASITGNPSTYPVVSSNDDNIAIEVYNSATSINDGSTSGAGSGASFYQGLIGWGSADIPSKPLIDLMITNNDPRLRAMFQPGENAAGVYAGLDPAQDATTQNALANGGTLSRYNFSTISRNTNVPGMLINAAEVSFLLAEYYLGAGNDAAAKTAYETGINQSIDYYYYLRTLSDDNTQGTLTPTTQTEKDAYIASSAISWDAAADNAAKLNLIATQKWTNYSVLQPIESWTEIRRLKLPALTFVPDNTNAQTLPPSRWVYPSDEATYNTENYQAVKANDNFKAKIFWDVK